MKKVFLSMLFLGVFATANAVEIIYKTDEECHAQACETLHDAEEVIPEKDLDAEQVYESAYLDCKGN